MRTSSKEVDKRTKLEDRKLEELGTEDRVRVCWTAWRSGREEREVKVVKVDNGEMEEKEQEKGSLKPHLAIAKLVIHMERAQ